MAVIIFNAGGNVDERHAQDLHGPRNAAKPRADVTIVQPGESLADLTRRAYGRNSAALRARIRNANASLTGEVRIPR